MAFTFSIKDTYRQAVEAASGGKQTVLYDDKGYPSIMNVIPKTLQLEARSGKLFYQTVPWWHLVQLVRLRSTL